MWNQKRLHIILNDWKYRRPTELNTVDIICTKCWQPVASVVFRNRKPRRGEGDWASYFRLNRPCGFCKDNNRHKNKADAERKRIRKSNEDTLANPKLCTPIEILTYRGVGGICYRVCRKKYVGNVCNILEEHHNALKDDPERLSTDFIKKMIEYNGECEFEFEMEEGE